MIDLERDGGIFTLTMHAGENRWNTTFVREFAKANALAVSMLSQTIVKASGAI